MKTRLKLSQITPWEKNPRSISKENFDRLKKSIEEDPAMLEARPLMVNHKGSKYILYGGNMRLKAMLELWWEEAPCHVFEDADEKTMIKRAFRDNMEYGEWSHNLIGQFFSKDDILNMHLPVFNMGFDFDKINFVLPDKSKDQDAIEDDVPPLDDKGDIIVEPGDIYRLGKHVLFCGSCTWDLKKLFGKNEQARAVFTDPPYWVSYKGTNNPNGKAWDIIEWDNLRGDELFDLLLGACKNIAKYTVESPAFYCCYASKNHIQFETAIIKAGMMVRQQLIWAKHMVLGHSDYHWAHEPILYCSKEKSPEVWNADRTRTTQLRAMKTIEEIQKMSKNDLVDTLKEIYNASTVLDIKKDPAKDYIHPTQNPVALPELCIKNSSYPEDIIFEPFCGSGSTLIACEKSGRQCRACEIDPQYVQQIIKRYSKYTFGVSPIECLNRKVDLNPLFIDLDEEIDE